MNEKKNDWHNTACSKCEDECFITVTSKTEDDIYRSVAKSFFDAFILLDVHKKNKPGSNLGSSFLMGGSIVFFTSVWRESIGLVSISLRDGSLTMVNQSE